jgi:hypothetical protein
MRVNCPGVDVLTGPSGEPLCVDSLGAPLAWIAVADGPEIDLETIGAPFSAGFSLVLLFWALGKGVSVIIDVVRR